MPRKIDKVITDARRSLGRGAQQLADVANRYQRRSVTRAEQMMRTRELLEVDTGGLAQMVRSDQAERRRGFVPQERQREVDATMARYAQQEAELRRIMLGMEQPRFFGAGPVSTVSNHPTVNTGNIQMASQFEVGQIVRVKEEFYNEYNFTRAGWMGRIQEIDGSGLLNVKGLGEFSPGNVELVPDQPAADALLRNPPDLRVGDWVYCEDLTIPEPAGVMARQPWYGQVLRVGAHYPGEVYVYYIACPPDQIRGNLYWAWNFKKISHELKEGEVDEVFKLGLDVIMLDGSGYSESKGTIVEVLPNFNGGSRTAYKVNVMGSGFGFYYANHFKKNEDAYKPDARGHVHDWELLWNGTYRKCSCGIKQWGLACWTDYQWRGRPPIGQLRHHPTLIEELVETPGWTTQPHRTRSYGLIPNSILNTRINVIGAGAIGSFTILSLVKMGFSNIHVWDPQKVDIENVGTQLYGEGQVGGYKVTKLNHLMDTLGPKNTDAQTHFQVVTHKELFKLVEVDTDDLDSFDYYTDSEDNPWNIPYSGVTIMAVDSMKARKEIWESVKDHADTTWVIDGRMGAENALLYTMSTLDDDDCEAYAKTLYDDADSVQEPCTARGTVYTALLLSGMICKAVKDVLTMNPKYPRIVHWNIADNAQVVYFKKDPDFGEEDFETDHQQPVATHAILVARTARDRQVEQATEYRPLLGFRYSIMEDDQITTITPEAELEF